MTTRLSDLTAKLIEVAEGLEGKARRAVDKSREAAEAWKPVGCPDPSKLLEGVERLA